jgi:hypothetical protein
MALKLTAPGGDSDETFLFLSFNLVHGQDEQLQVPIMMMLTGAPNKVRGRSAQPASELR